MHVDWKWLLIGAALGYFAVPLVAGKALGLFSKGQ